MTITNTGHVKIFSKSENRNYNDVRRRITFISHRLDIRRRILSSSSYNYNYKDGSCPNFQLIGEPQL